MTGKLGILLTVCAAVLAINLDTTIVNVALPSIATELDAGTRDLQWIVDGYNLAFAALVLAAGSLSDRCGRRPALIIGLVGFAGRASSARSSTSSGALIAARVAMGAFAALIFPTTLSIISNTFPDRRQRAAALGVWGAVVGIGVAAGPVVGGAAARALLLGQRLLGAGPAGPADGGRRPTCWCPSRATPRSRRSTCPGSCCLVAMLGTLVYTIIEAPDHGWASARDARRLRVSAACSRCFVVVRAADRRTRCSTSACSATGGSAPRAGR